MKIQIDLIEPLIFLRKPPNWSTLVSSKEYNLSQLRGIITIHLNNDLNGDELENFLVQINFLGRLSKYAATKQEQFQFHDHIIKVPISAGKTYKEDGRGYTYSVPFSFSVSPDLPPTVDTELGRVSYHITACIIRDKAKGQKDVIAKAIETNDIYLVGDSASSDRTDGESSISGNHSDNHTHSIEDVWRNTFHWNWTFVTNHSTMGGIVPLRFSLKRIGSDKYPQAELKLIKISLIEQTELTSSTKHKTVQRSWDLLVVGGNKKQALLPSTFDQACHPRMLSGAERAINEEMVDDKGECKNTTEVTKKAENQLRNSEGPWILAWDIKMPSCENTRCNSTVIHALSPVSIKHSIEIKMYIETQSEEGIYEIALSFPFILRCIYLTNDFAQLPCFYCSCFLPHPYESHEERDETGLLTLFDNEPQSMVVKETEGEKASLFSPFFTGKSDKKPFGKSPGEWLQNRKNTANRWIELMSQFEPSPPSYHD